MSTIREFAANPVFAAGIAALSASLFAATAAHPAAQVKPPRQDYTSGSYLYQTFCASCHGTGGRADGPVADLLFKRPPDLTTIAARHGGTFPRQEVNALIDGRRLVPGHGSTDMPIWGDVLKVTEGHDDAIIRKRIEALVAHVESLQQK